MATWQIVGTSPSVIGGCCFVTAGVQHEGNPVQLVRAQGSGDTQATVLSVPAGSYLKLPLDFPEEHGAH
eukprot:996966-Amphidinium_carterae.1